MVRESGRQESAEELYARVFRALRPRTVLPRVQVDYCQFANVHSMIEWKGDVLRARISDLFAAAPHPVQESLAFILLSKLFRKPIPTQYSTRYRRFLNSRDAISAAERMRRERGYKPMLPARGRVYDLVEMFEDLNLRFFHGLMARPEVGWSPRISRSIVGHYDPSHHAIVISRLLDSAEVPAFVVEYVLYHEMLHLRYPTENKGARRCIHTAEFRRAEKQFPLFQQAQELLKRICHSQWAAPVKR